jgi:hypothetical protein
MRPYNKDIMYWYERRVLLVKLAALAFGTVVAVIVYCLIAL